ncbi:hypothetical protein TRSC58_07464 [Trypanosoma rangeli SC58]|uniref:Uncharacterized protein n=1 Tax=Trypanosoma rangeli SC58 TaxID=429131 RepID=A0A061IRL6_TRYRA|nr:hypothetical protein TRSC58_07464 [Trypanosoma rangeli SC58]
MGSPAKQRQAAPQKKERKETPPAEETQKKYQQRNKTQKKNGQQTVTQTCWANTFSSASPHVISPFPSSTTHTTQRQLSTP